MVRGRQGCELCKACELHQEGPCTSCVSWDSSQVPHPAHLTAHLWWHPEPARPYPDKLFAWGVPALQVCAESWPIRCLVVPFSRCGDLSAEGLTHCPELHSCLTRLGFECKINVAPFL